MTKDACFFLSFVGIAHLDIALALSILKERKIAPISLFGYSEVPNNHRGHNNSIGCHLRQESIIVQGTIIVEADNLLTI